MKSRPNLRSRRRRRKFAVEALESRLLLCNGTAVVGEDSFLVIPGTEGIGADQVLVAGLLGRLHLDAARALGRDGAPGLRLRHGVPVRVPQPLVRALFAAIGELEALEVGLLRGVAVPAIAAQRPALLGLGLGGIGLRSGRGRNDTPFIGLRHGRVVLGRASVGHDAGRWLKGIREQLG